MFSVGRSLPPHPGPLPWGEGARLGRVARIRGAMWTSRPAFALRYELSTADGETGTDRLGIANGIFDCVASCYFVRVRLGAGASFERAFAGPLAVGNRGHHCLPA